MTKKELKKIIKECMKEVIFEDGVLSTIIKEVMSVHFSSSITSQRIVTEQVKPNEKEEEITKKTVKKNSRLDEMRKHLNDSIGKGAYGGVDIFSNVEPLSDSGIVSESSKLTPSNPMSGIDPRDPGVNIESLFGNSKEKWNILAKGKK